MGSCPALYITQRGALESQPQVIKFTSCLTMVGGSPGTTASSTTKTGHHDMAEILLNVALKPQRSKTKKSFETLSSTTIFDIST